MDLSNPDKYIVAGSIDDCLPRLSDPLSVGAPHLFGETSPR